MNRKILIMVILAALLPMSVPVPAYMGSADTPDEVDRIDAGEEPIVRLNPDDPSYDVWKNP